MDDALAVVADLNRRGLAASLDLLGESTATEDDARRAAAAYGPILDAAHHRGARTGSARLPATLAVFDRVWDASFHNTGIALQAYLRRTPQDVDRYVARGASIRLCKGAYAEPPAVALPRKADVDRQFARLAEHLLDQGTSPALATHDERLIARAKTFAREHAISQDRFEFQFLHGIRRDLQDALARERHLRRPESPAPVARALDSHVLAGQP